MRFLKRKINLRKELIENEEEELSLQLDSKIESPPSDTTNSSKDSNSPSVLEYILPTRKPRKNPTSPEGNSKNIVKNYGKALCAFATSPLAIPYLDSIRDKCSFQFVSIENFVNFIDTKKSGMTNIVSLRRMLVPETGDNKETVAFKTIFQKISIVFLKYFCVNWIFSGKIVQKKAHLKFRFKMLRRIIDPEHFTYLKTSL